MDGGPPSDAAGPTGRAAAHTVAPMAYRLAPPGPGGPARFAEQAAAAVAALALGVRIPIAQGITPGYLIAIALLPVWFGTLRRFQGARWIFWLALACIPFATLLAQLNSVDHKFARTVFVGTTVLMLGFVCGLGVLLWAQQVISRRWVGALFGVGMLAGELASPGQLTADNPLKFAVALPATIIVLSAVEEPRRLGRQLVAVLALGVLGALVDARSFFAICLLTAALVAWQMRPRATRRHGSWGWTVLLIAGVGVVVYYLGTTLAVDGYLGVETQQRTVAQIDASGSLLLGGRPELGATAALVESRPWGFGAGTVPNLSDITAAKSGMAALGYDPNNGYVERYMFGTGINLHSVAGDTWAAFGILGVALALSTLFLMIRGAAVRIAARRGSALTILLTSYGLWNTFFSPLYSSAPIMTLGLAFLLLPTTDLDRPGRGTSRSRPATEPPTVHSNGLGDRSS